MRHKSPFCIKDGLLSYRSQVVHQFGSAKFIRQPNDQHELVGGTDADLDGYSKCSSLFAQEIVFTHAQECRETLRQTAPDSSAIATINIFAYPMV